MVNSVSKMEMEEFKEKLAKALEERKDPKGEEILIRSGRLSVELPTRLITIEAKEKPRLAIDFSVHVESTEKDLVNYFHDEQEKMRTLYEEFKDYGLGTLAVSYGGEFALKAPRIEFTFSLLGPPSSEALSSIFIDILEKVQEQLPDVKRKIQLARLNFVEQRTRAFEIRFTDESKTSPK